MLHPTEYKAEILKRSGVTVPTRFVNCLISERLTFEDILKLPPAEALRIPNFGTAMVELLKRIQRSQDPALHQDNQHLLLAVRDLTVELIARLRQEIPAFNVLEAKEQVWIVINIRLRDFDAFKSFALGSTIGGGTPHHMLRMAMNEFGFNEG